MFVLLLHLLCNVFFFIPFIVACTLVFQSNFRYSYNKNVQVCKWLHRNICFSQSVYHTINELKSYWRKSFIVVLLVWISKNISHYINSANPVVPHLLHLIETKTRKWQTKTERKSPLFDGYKQAGQHSIVLFWYSTYNSKLRTASYSLKNKIK